MATVTDNVFTEGLSGRVGTSLVFRTLRGKTFVTTPARKPDKRKESTAQRGTRVTFREASQWAQYILQDAAKRAYYQQRARKMKLPNAYTAALTDYMRKPQVTTSTNKDQSINYRVSKKEFNLKKVEVIVSKTEGYEIRTVPSRGMDWYFVLSKEEIVDTRIRTTDAADREMVLVLKE